MASWVGNPKYCCIHYYQISVSIPNNIQIGGKHTSCYWLVLGVSPVGQKIVIAISKSFYVVFCPIVVQMYTKFYPNQTKNIFYWLALVDWSGQSKDSYSRYVDTHQFRKKRTHISSAFSRWVENNVC